MSTLLLFLVETHLRTTRGGLWYHRVVHVPQVENHCHTQSTQWNMWVNNNNMGNLEQPLLRAFPVRCFMPVTTKEEIVALNLNSFLVFFFFSFLFYWCQKFGKQPLDWTGGINQTKQSITASRHYSNCWLEFRKNNELYCVSHCIWIYNLFYLWANY